jgi:hypothetical protein
VNVSLPTIGGGSTIGSSLTASPGTWSGNGLQFGYQWQRCGSDGSGCAAVSGATASTFAIGDADVGSTFRITVVGSNHNGSAIATSSPTGAVPPPTTATTTTATTTTATTTTATTTTTTTAQTTTTAPTTTTTTNLTGSVLYKKDWEDGLIDSGGWSHQASDTISPNPFNGILYGSIGAVSAPVDTGSRAGQFTLPAWTGGMQGVEMMHNRVVQNGEDDWFAVAAYFPSGWQNAMTASDGSSLSETFTCPNYYSVNSCMDALIVTRDSVFVLTNSGACPGSDQPPGCPYYSGNPDYPGVCRGFSSSQCGPWYVVQPGKLQTGVWYEFVFHVYYTLGTDGVVQAWYRTKGGSWTLAVDKQGGFPTLQTGPTAFGTTVTASNINGWKSTDQFGAYRHAATLPVTEYVDNWCRATALSAAQSCFN